MIRLALLILCLALPAQATPEYRLPTLFRVVDVAANDTLNVREGPGVEHAIVGELAPDARDIEAVATSHDGGWLLVNIGERSGWVSLRFLEPEPARREGFTCSGTEPFWSIDLMDDTPVWSTPEGNLDLSDVQVLDVPWFQDRRQILLAELLGTPFVLTVTHGQCTDGMSDRAYGLEATGAIGPAGSATLVTGCCSIAP